MIASFSRTIIGPTAFRSLAITGRPSVLKPTTISPSRRRKSARLLASERIAMI